MGGIEDRTGGKWGGGNLQGDKGSPVWGRAARGKGVIEGRWGRVKEDPTAGVGSRGCPG